MLSYSPELFGTPTKVVMDAIHGGIPIFSHEKFIIDHPLFLRLKHIKQNDILFYVFPGATHTRFEHSVGVMHVANRIFKNMIRNYISYRRIEKINEEQVNAIQYLYGCLRIASLLHDVGHMPFSHQFEESKLGNEIFCDKNYINDLLSGKNKIYFENEPKKLKHEYFSIFCAIDILGSIKEEYQEFSFEIEDIIGMMEEGSAKPSEKFIKFSVLTLKLFIGKSASFINSDEVALRFRNLFKDIISGEIDADKMDYLLRDSYFSGADYGKYHIDHLIKNLNIGWDTSEITKIDWIGIAINEKGKEAFEDFVHSRFMMYKQVYNHKHVVGFKWLLREAVFEISEDNDSKEEIKEKIYKISEFHDFTDTYFWELFRNHAKKNKNSACYYIVNKIGLIYIKSVRIDDKTAFAIGKIEKKIKKEINGEIIGTDAPSRFSKINPTYDKLRQLNKNITGTLELVAINSDYFDNSKDIKIRHYFKYVEFKKET